MRLINLTQIKTLWVEAQLQKLALQSHCLNRETHLSRIDEDNFVAVMKIHEQAKNLYKALKRVHTVCADMATGNIQLYVDQLNNFNDSDEPFSALHEIESCFVSGDIYDLPTTIEQYAELHQMAGQYRRLQAIRREGLGDFFADLPRNYLITDEFGELIVISEAEVSIDTRSIWEAKDEIKGIEIEYCLDGYNTFYKECLRLIEAGQIDNDVEGCALGILTMISIG